MEVSLSKQLADNLAYYVEDPKRRCFGLSEITKQNGCYYSGSTIGKETDGCFVGRFLTPEDRVKADTVLANNDAGSDIINLIKIAPDNDIIIPDVIKNNVELFQLFQQLHDAGEIYWGEGSLTDDGKKKLSKIIRTYALDAAEFSKFL